MMVTRETASAAEWLEAAAAKQQREAAERVSRRSDERARKIAAIKTPGGLAEADDPERIVTRIDRLSHYYPDVRPVSPAEVLAGKHEALTAAGAVLERVINTPDFVDVRYLEGGERAARSVGRLDIRDSRGRLVGYGTGSLVSQQLLLTNHHVLPDTDTAAASAIEFNYQDGVDGKPLQPVLLPLDPKTFFCTDEQLDFTLVAVAADDSALGPFGFNRLIGQEGKAIPGDFVSIVQHPRGEKKQVALRDNRVVDVLDLFLHYQTDTEPGSSGSPVFNDQWEIIALHHAGVPAPEHTELGGWVNEGIRVSQILRHLAGKRFPEQQQALVDQLRALGHAATALGASTPTTSERSPTSAPMPAGRLGDGDGWALSWTTPLELAVELRRPSTSSGTPAPPSFAAAPAALEAFVEPYHDEDLAARHGYDHGFVGVEVPMPRVIDESVVARLDDGSHVLNYEHFSIVMDKVRRLALFTASNVDAGEARKKPEPGRDYSRRGLTGLGPHDQEKWFIDPRIAPDQQLPDRFFTKDRSAFDKGHIVRREDVAWGDSYEELRRANGDTFHVTNCSPQIADFNRSNLDGLWGELENIVLAQARTERYCLFAGPLLRANDREFHGVDDTGQVSVKIPRQFWKIVVAHTGDELETFAFILDQDLSNTDFEFAVDPLWRKRMISIPNLQKLVAAVEFPPQLHDSDQIDTPEGETIRTEARIETISV